MSLSLILDIFDSDCNKYFKEKKEISQSLFPVIATEKAAAPAVPVHIGGDFWPASLSDCVDRAPPWTGRRHVVCASNTHLLG